MPDRLPIRLVDCYGMVLRKQRMEMGYGNGPEYLMALDIPSFGTLFFENFNAVKQFVGSLSSFISFADHIEDKDDTKG